MSRGKFNEFQEIGIRRINATNIERRQNLFRTFNSETSGESEGNEAWGVRCKEGKEREGGKEREKKRKTERERKQKDKNKEKVEKGKQMGKNIVSDQTKNRYRC